MSLESDLVVTLKTVCPRVFPDLAPATTALPYVTFQNIGGTPARFIDGSASDKRNAVVQVNVWAKSRLDAISTVRAIEDAVCSAAGYSAQPIGESISRYEPDPELYGSMQRFDVWATR